MASNKKYWKSVEELNPESSVIETLKQNEFVEQIPVDDFLGDKETLEASSTTRRDFLKYVGFSTAAATLASCDGPVVKSIPYIIQPEQIRPGVADYYATTIADGYDFASVLVKTREGRPIKIENNNEASVNGAANARVQASVLTMYDAQRVQGPKKAGEDISWSALDAEVMKALNDAQAGGKQIVFLTQTYASPSTNRLVKAFSEKYSNAKHIQYDAISEDAALNAFELKYGTRALADYDFAKADVIVSVGADFLSDWQGGGFAKGYSSGRVPKDGKMSYHVQFESNMSLSGANADKRVPLTVAEQKIALAKIYGYVNGVSVSGKSLPENVEAAVKSAANRLKKAGSKGVLITGLQDVDAQALALQINENINSQVVDTDAPKMTRQGNVANLNQLMADMKSGNVGVLIMSGVNPMYTLANADDFKAGLDKVGLSVTFTMKEDETALVSNIIAAAPHYLESWGDVELKKGSYSLIQPTIRPLFDTRQFQDALLKWAGIETAYYDYIKETWTSSVLGGSEWNKALHDGVFTPSVSLEETVVEEVTQADEESLEEEVPTSAFVVASAVRKLANAASEGMELVLYPKVGMGDGKQANNPWLQEFPDPITRVSWDNYLTMSSADAGDAYKNWNVANGGLNGSYAKVTLADGTTLEKVPVIIQPGQAKGTVGLAFGYGKKAGMQQEMQTGVNAYKVYKEFSDVQQVTLEPVSGEHEFACVQLHNTLMGRGDIVKETTLEVFNTKSHHEWNHKPEVSLNHEEVEAVSVDLWDSFDRSIGHHFNLSIDLNACTGCGACVVACHAENNVPVVGKAEVRKSRDMHWLRIDRYYSSEETFEGDNETKENISGLGDSLSTFGEMENASANPQVAFQPVMCQHCNHAPCETVCPVAATSHSRQGQNHMAYNRCVGTRYCANNCPYKVRRFNWFLYNNNDEFDFHMNNDLGKMVLNPDVNVRSRGVMEKCSLCIQKTQKTILDAKREGREVKEGEFETACSAACPSNAMVFGDINMEGSKVAELKESDRMYHLLEHVGTRPNVFYHVKVRNTNEA
ncbi:TAT-variant-translocated molybdopterin oxidoreductase [Flavobacteriaceae bacterium M23B6Z8]